MEKIQHVVKHCFLDTNVLLDYLLDRQPFSTYASLLLQLAKAGRVRLSITGVSFATTYYVARRAGHQPSTVLDAPRELRHSIGVVPMTAAVIDAALASPLTDFEDAIQYAAAVLALLS